MAYNPNVPLPNQTLSDTHAPIRENFSLIQSAFDRNHTPVTNGAAGGKHKYIEFPVQAAPPALVGTDIGVYSKQPAGGVDHVTLGTTQLFVDRSSGAAAIRKIPWTAASLITVPTPSQGWAFLPCGWLIKWGNVSIAGSGTTQNINLSTGADIPVFSAVFTAQVTPFSTTGGLQPWNIYLAAYTNTSITVGLTANFPGNIGFRFLMIGLAV